MFVREPKSIVSWNATFKSLFFTIFIKYNFVTIALFTANSAHLYNNEIYRAHEEILSCFVILTPKLPRIHVGQLHCNASEKN